MSDCCCGNDAYANDPYQGEKQEVIVEHLCLDLSVCDRCQETDERVMEAVVMLKSAFDTAGYRLESRKIIIEDEEMAVEHKFLSSPTIRVNGVDICPEVIENPCDCCRDITDYDVYCRQFDFNGRLYEVPPTAYVVRRILEIVFGGEEPEDVPYTLPENIKGFFDGKEAKQARDAKERLDGFVSAAEKIARESNLADADSFVDLAKQAWGAYAEQNPSSRQSCCCCC